MVKYKKYHKNNLTFIKDKAIDQHYKECIYQLKEINKKQNDDVQTFCSAVIRSLELKYGDKDYIESTDYQQLMEYIYQHA